MSAQRVQILVISALTLSSVPAIAMPIDIDSDMRISWDNTLDETLVGQPGAAGFGPAGRCTPGVNQFASSVFLPCLSREGLTSARTDWLSRVVMNYQDFGLQVSTEAWYDPAYDLWKNKGNPSANNALATQYFSATGGTPYANIELYDAFIHGSTDLGDDQPLSFRIGRQVALWGESLYFVDNGIAAGQAPVDTYRYQSGNYYQSNASFLPVGQGTFSWQPTTDLALVGYYQFEWRPGQFTPYDAYDSNVTILSDQFTHQVILPGPGGNPEIFNRVNDITPKGNDQFGLGLRWHAGDYDFGLYGLSYDAKTPELYFFEPANSFAAGATGHYALVYPQGTEIYGASLNGPLGDASFGAEVSARRNMPLVNAGVLVPNGVAADNDRHPLYPIGDTLHAQFSWIYATPPLPGVPGGANWTGEIAANDVLGVTANAGQLVLGRTREAAALRTEFEPQFFQVAPDLDLTLPLGLGYNFLGRSETDASMNRGTADLSVGATVTLDRSWKFGLNGTHYFGDTQNNFLPNEPAGVRRPLSDSDFVSLTVERGF
jgi:hypothetical protein